MIYTPHHIKGNAHALWYKSAFNPSVSVVTCPQQCSNGGECFRYDGGPYGIYGCDCQDDYVGMFCDYRSCEFVATVNCNTETLVSLTQAMHCHVFLCR